MSHLRRARQGPRPVPGHDRARRLAAEHLHDALGPEQMAWLADHLADCPACTAAVADYEAQRAELRSLPFAEPPRDLWARTSAALEREEWRAARPAGRLRPALDGGRLVPYGVLAGALVVAVVVGTSILSGGGATPPLGASAAPSVAPSVAAAATPVAISAAPVAWLMPAADGTYALNVAPVERVCPPDATPDCALIDGSARATIRLSAAPRAVVRSPTGAAVVVVDAATTGSAGGSVYVVGVPAQAPAAATPGPSVAPITIGTAVPEESASATPSAPFGSPFGEPSSAPSGGPASPVSPSPAQPSDMPSAGPSASAAPSDSAVPTASPSGDVTAIASGVIVIGETAAYSPDGQWFAFTARPADGSQGPDIFVWHVGDATARPVTTDHASVFSSWLGNLVIGSRAVPDATGGTAASPSPEAPAISSPEPGVPSSPGVDSASPAVTQAPPAPSDATIPGAEASAAPTGPTATPGSFLLDPGTGGRAELTGAVWRPVADPSGQYVVYWSGTLGLDPESGEWVPFGGTLLIAPWSWLASGIPASLTTGDDLVLPAGSPSPTPVDTSLDGSGAPGVDASAAAPAVGGDGLASGLFPSPPPDAAFPLPTPSADVGASPSPSPSPLTPLTSPEPLLAPDTTGAVQGQFQDWEARWDPTGERLAVWIGDALDPRLGRLSLLTVDRPTGQVDGERSLLLDAPALSGFSIAGGRLAWATPPGQDGEGSRLLVLGWTGDGVGSLDGQPVVGPEAVVVVR